MPEQLDPLRQAAVTLLTAAPPGAVLLAMRVLLDGWEQNTTLAAPTEPLQAVEHARGTVFDATAPAPPPAASIGPRPGIKARAASAPNGADAGACELLRQQVHAAREARGITVRALADELGVANATLKLALYGRQPPSRPLRQRLTDWLAAAPEVAAVAAEPFRANGGKHKVDASDDTDRLAA